MKPWGLILALLLAACAAEDRLIKADGLAQSAMLKRTTVDAPPFTLIAYSRIRDPNQPVNLYIEGDGPAFISRNRVSPDPTPRHALALALAAADPALNVVYLARPCQFHDFTRSTCDSRYWTDKRFSEEVIAAMSQAVGFFMQQTYHQQLNLIGYSGGAAVAVLIAARRDDVASLRTVAGNLDHVALNNYHEVSAMPESLNPMDFADKLSSLPQIHFLGTEDKIIPLGIAESFIQSQHGRCAIFVKVSQATHEEGWIEQWPALLSRGFPCKK